MYLLNAQTVQVFLEISSHCSSIGILCRGVHICYYRVYPIGGGGACGRGEEGRIGGGGLMGGARRAGLVKNGF